MWSKRWLCGRPVTFCDVKFLCRCPAAVPFYCTCKEKETKPPSACVLLLGRRGFAASSWQYGEFVTCDCVFIRCSFALRRQRSAVLALNEPTPSRPFYSSFFSYWLLRFAPCRRKLLPVSTQWEGRQMPPGKKQRIMSQFGIELLSLSGIWFKKKKKITCKWKNQHCFIHLWWFYAIRFQKSTCTVMRCSSRCVTLTPLNLTVFTFLATVIRWPTVYNLWDLRH